MLTISFVQPFVLYGNGGAGKSALLSKSALQSLKVIFIALLQPFLYPVNQPMVNKTLQTIYQNCCRNGFPLPLQFTTITITMITIISLFTIIAGMALTCSAAAHGPLLRHNSKLHGSRTFAQVMQFKPNL